MTTSSIPNITEAATMLSFLKLGVVALGEVKGNAGTSWKGDDRFAYFSSPYVTADKISRRIVVNFSGDTTTTSGPLSYSPALEVRIARVFEDNGPTARFEVGCFGPAELPEKSRRKIGEAVAARVAAELRRLRCELRRHLPGSCPCGCRTHRRQPPG